MMFSYVNAMCTIFNVFSYMLFTKPERFTNPMNDIVFVLTSVLSCPLPPRGRHRAKTLGFRSVFNIFSKLFFAPEVVGDWTMFWWQSEESENLGLYVCMYVCMYVLCVLSFQSTNGNPSNRVAVTGGIR